MLHCTLTICTRAAVTRKGDDDDVVSKSLAVIVLLEIETTGSPSFYRLTLPSTILCKGTMKMSKLCCCQVSTLPVDNNVIMTLEASK